MIQLIGTQANWSRWFNAAAVGVDNVATSISFDVGYLAIAAASAGRGAVIASTIIARPELESGRLVILTGPVLTACSSHRIYISRKVVNRPAIKVFVNWLKKAMQ